MIGKRYKLRDIDIKIIGDSGDTWEVSSKCEPELESISKRTLADAIDLDDAIDISVIVEDLISELKLTFPKLKPEEVEDAVENCLKTNDCIDSIRVCATTALKKLLRKNKRTP